jgi:type III restriction enzyme
MFFKIPTRFKIETPIGTTIRIGPYNLEQNGEQKLYFVLGDQGDNRSIWSEQPRERLKIHCGKAHFAALENDVKFSELPVKDWREFKANLR